MNRRDLLAASLCLPIAALGGGGAWARALVEAAPGTGGGFDEGTVPSIARGLAERPWQAPAGSLPSWLEGMDYDAWRDIRFDPARALWNGEGRGFTAQFFHPGFLFRETVQVHEVADGHARRIDYAPGLFDFGANPVPRGAGGVPADGFAGFRLHAALNRPDYLDEVCAFLGGSYFRAVARGQLYGLSARGLALRTADPEGEEFPRFTSFWIERPAPGATQVVVHALLDSPSVAGAYRFAITPGAETVMDVRSRLYPRVRLDKAGIAPLTSMFQFDASDRGGFDDYRAAVHDSDGLALWTGAGEQLWRPLANPAVLQESTFADRDPRGFGLMQRKRRFADFGDAEARYERRPSLWVEPGAGWGAGQVHLVEIPTADEYLDNIVAFWRPDAPLEPGREHLFEYRLHWCDAHDWNPGLTRVTATATGALPGGGRRFVVDLAATGGDAEPVPEVLADRGRVDNPSLQRLPHGGWRLAFELHPGGEPVVELRARLLGASLDPLSETWLYRWT